MTKGLRSLELSHDFKKGNISLSIFNFSEIYLILNQKRQVSRKETSVFHVRRGKETSLFLDRSRDYVSQKRRIKLFCLLSSNIDISFWTKILLIFLPLKKQRSYNYKLQDFSPGRTHG